MVVSQAIKQLHQKGMIQLRHRVGKFIHDTREDSQVVYLTGTVPMRYNGASYNSLVDIVGLSNTKGETLDEFRK